VPEWPAVLAACYGAGVVVGLARTDAAPLTRLGLALLWPVGPLAFVATLLVLLAASLIAFPWFGAAVAAAALAYSVLSV
jgi:hypothetical protein